MSPAEPPPRLRRAPANIEHEAARLGSPKARLAYVKQRRRDVPGGKRRRLVAADLASRAGLTIDPDAGFLQVAARELDGAAAVVAAANDLIERAGADRVEATGGKPMSKGLLPMADLGLESPFLRFALSEGVLGPVSAYLTLLPILTYVDVWCSRHVPKAPFSSQLWHLDHADVTQVKVFLHCDDIELDSGPLTVLDAGASTALAKKIRYTVADGRLSDETVRACAGDGERVGIPLTGPQGAAAFVDTSRCFHFGSRVEAGAPTRKLVVFQFLTPYAFAFQHDHRQEAPFRALAGRESSERDRLLLGAD